MEQETFDQKLQDAANEIAGLKAYDPDKLWTFSGLTQQVTDILRKHLGQFVAKDGGDKPHPNLGP